MFARSTSEAIELQTSLFGSGEPAADQTFATIDRLRLDDVSWVDHGPRWLHGSDELFTALVQGLPWRQRRVVMYDRLVDEPRLTWWWQEGDSPQPPPVLISMGEALGRRYDRHFDSIGCNLYRDGRDSVAWHADRIRTTQADPLVAIVSLGQARPFLLRPRGGGPSRSFLLGHGDLFVMGGSCQHDWEHTVPKVARAGPRLSVSFRHEAPAPDDGSPRSARDRHLLTTVRAHPAGRLVAQRGGRASDAATNGGRPWT